MGEFCLNVKPFMQPHPARHKGGDCFACSLTAALQHLFPEKGVTFDQVYECFDQGSRGNPNCTWDGMGYAIDEAQCLGLTIESIREIVHPQLDVERRSCSWWHEEPIYRYARHLEAWLKAGWLALTEINFAGAGPYTPDGKCNSTDHFVLLDGVRDVWEEFPDGRSAALRHYVHVVCSVKGAYWIRVENFLRKHGGAGWQLLRRNPSLYEEAEK